jgi:hypothetical protein
MEHEKVTLDIEDVGTGSSPSSLQRFSLEDVPGQGPGTPGSATTAEASVIWLTL